MFTANTIYCSVAIPPPLRNDYSFMQKTDGVFKLYFSHAYYVARTVLKPCLAEPPCGIYFNLGDEFDCFWPDQLRNKTKFYFNHSALLSLPYSYQEMCVMKGYHSSILLNIDPDLIAHYAAAYPYLDKLLESRKQESAFVFSGYPIFLEESIVRSLKQIITNGHGDVTRDEKNFMLCHQVMVEYFNHLAHILRHRTVVKRDDDSLVGEIV